jgi:hypothetical protein
MARGTVASHTGSSWLTRPSRTVSSRVFSSSCRSGTMKGDTSETLDADALEHV